MLEHHSKVIDDILSNLFEPDERRLRELLLVLIRKNNEYQRVHGDGILYDGVWYPNPETGSTIRSPRILFHEDIKSEMEEYVRQELDLKNDKLRLKQGLHQILKSCNSLQDIRDALPETLMNLPYLASLAELPRTRPEGYTVLGSERGKRQYEQVVERLKFYSITGLFY